MFPPESAFLEKELEILLVDICVYISLSQISKKKFQSSVLMVRHYNHNNIIRRVQAYRLWLLFWLVVFVSPQPI